MADFIRREMDNVSVKFISFNLYDQSDVDMNHKVALLGAWITVLQLYCYIGVDSSVKRPWVAFRRVSKPLELNQFKEYIEHVIDRLTSQPPNQNYSALVHIHTIINLLTTMEYQDGR